MCLRTQAPDVMQPPVVLPDAATNIWLDRTKRNHSPPLKRVAASGLARFQKRRTSWSRLTDNYTKNMNEEQYNFWPLLSAVSPSLQVAVKSLIAATVTITLGSFLWYFVSRRSNLTSKHGGGKMPPGSFGLPFLGETREYIALQKANTARNFFESRAAKYGEVFATSLFGFVTVSLPAPFGNKFLFSNENTLVINQWPECLKPLLGDESVAWQTGEEHKHTRSVLMTFLDPEALQRFVGKVSAIIQKHLDDKWEGKQQIVVFPLMKRLTFSIACSLYLSVENEDEINNLLMHFCSYAAGMLQVPIDFPGTKYHKAKTSRRKICKTLDALILKRREDLDSGRALKNQDLLTTLLTTRDPKGRLFSNSAIQDNVIALLFAGHDTTSSTISLALKYLAENKSCLHQVVDEQLQIKSEKSSDYVLDWEDLKKMKYTWKVVQETLRLQPPVQGGFRKALADVDIGGYRVPKDTMFYWTIHRSHRNAKLFPDPDKFDPSRFEGAGPAPYTFVPFGGGPRICPGNEFARMEALTFLHHVVTRFHWSPLDPHEPVTIDPLAHPLLGLPVTLQSRKLHVD